MQHLDDPEVRESAVNVINKIGSEMFCEAAKSKEIPVYICTDSWKFDVATIFGFDEIIEKRHETEVWSDKPKNIKISNYAFLYGH